MVALAFVVAALALIPAVLYLVGWIRDPFHPLVFVGVVSYAISPDRLIRHPSDYLSFLDAPYYTTYLAITLISILGIYLGWFFAGRIKNRALAPRAPHSQYHVTTFIAVAIVCIGIAIPIHFLYRTDQEIDVSGYAREWGLLWITAAILLVQAFFLSSPKSRMLIFPLILLALIPPIERFLNYGQRGDTFRVASLVMLGFLMVRRRPSKPVVLIGVASLGLLLATLGYTRKIIESGEAPDRIHALAYVLPDFIDGKYSEPNASDECIYGAAAVESVRSNHAYGYGLGYTAGLFIQFVPRQVFPDKREWIRPNGGGDFGAIKSETGIEIPSGSAPSGFANGFFELGWACPIVWFILGYFYRRRWDSAIQSDDIRHTGYLVAFTMAMLYALTQDIFTAELNMINVMLPLLLVYQFSRHRTEEPAVAELSV